MKAHFGSALRAGQVEAERPADPQPRPALRRRGHPAARGRQPGVRRPRRLSGGQEQPRAAGRLRLHRRAAPVRRARRLRALLRQDALRADHRHHQRRGVLRFVRRATFPTNAADPGPSLGQLPTDPLLRGGPVVNRALLDQLYPPGIADPEHGHRRARQPGSPYSVHRISHDRLRAAARRDRSASVDYVHAWARDLFMSRELNPGAAGRHEPHGQREPRRTRQFVASVLRARRTWAAPTTTRWSCSSRSVSPQLQRASRRTRCRIRAATPAATASRRASSRSGRPAPRRQRGADRLRSAAQPGAERHAHWCRGPAG